MSRLWAHQPGNLNQLFQLMSQAFTPSGLNLRQRGILVTAAASARGDSYCSLARGGKLVCDAALIIQPGTQASQGPSPGF